MQHEARRSAEDGSTEAHMLEGTGSGVRKLAAVGRLGAAHAVCSLIPEVFRAVLSIVTRLIRAVIPIDRAACKCFVST